LYPASSTQQQDLNPDWVSHIHENLYMLRTKRPVEHNAKHVAALGRKAASRAQT